MTGEKQKRAIALAYDQTNDSAPIVKAKGKGYVAQKIIEKAKEKDVPIYEDPSLAKMLDVLNIDEKIPEELFMAVAEVFAFIYQVDQKSKNY